ncbi:MAG: DUF2764 domain-containing protein [Prevotellaceae bacterium]|jgi:hypothetical protein|nr:DUF2764 domain-containing protein [Prevotellaceae bacterium]
MSKYYYLISSLPELFFDAEDSKNPDFLYIRDYMLENFSTTDIDYIYNLLNNIDNHNLITAIYHKNRAWKKGGQMEFQSTDELSKFVLPNYMLNFLEYIDDYKTEYKSNPDELAAEKYLLEHYYAQMENSDNRFITKWFKFDREVKNIQAAYLCKQLGTSMDDYLVKKDDITEFLLKNTSSDFGLLRERDYMPELFQALETQDVFDRENKLDMLRWKQIDEINVMEYFSVDVALGTLQKAYIADRWLALDNENGKKLFRKLIDDLIKKL